MTLGSCVGDMRATVRATNKNVLLSFIAGIFGACSYGIWGYSVMAAYIFFIAGGSAESKANTRVGVSEGMQGLAQLIPGLCAGYMADKWRRDKVLKLSGVVSTIAIGFTMLVMLGGGKFGYASLREGKGDFLPWIDDEAMVTMHGTPHSLAGGSSWRYILLTVGLCAWSASSGMSNAPMQAIMADSVETGNRSDIYSWQYTANQLAYAMGPLLALLFFVFLGDRWTTQTLTTVVFVGVAMNVPSMIALFYFDDDEALGKESEAASASSASGTDEEKVASGGSCCSGRVTIRAIPFILWSSDLIWGFGSGMTVKFFPIFFLDKHEGLDLPPTVVMVIFFISPVTVALGSRLAQKISSKGFGRVQTDILFWLFGIACLATLSLSRWFGLYGDGHPPKLWWHKALIVLLYLGRTWGVSSTTALRSSILMDFVPKRTRARWSSLDAFTSFGWSGSAMVGGMLIDRYNYSVTFLITAALHTTSVAVRLMLLPLVPRVEQKPEDGQIQGGSNKAKMSRTRTNALIEEALNEGECEGLLSSTE